MEDHVPGFRGPLTAAPQAGGQSNPTAAVHGLVALFRTPWLFSDFTPAQDGRGPPLGEHNAPVLKGLLGLSGTEFDRMVAEGVIA